MEENQRKITPWKIIKWTVLSISILVYAVTFTRIFVSCDADISDDIILTSEEKADFENLDIDYQLFNYQPSSWTNEEGTIQIKNIYYLEPISELQLTVRYRISTFDTEENRTPFEFKLRVVEDDSRVEADGENPVYEADLPGETIGDIETRIQSRFDYKYIRLCASDIVVEDGVKKTERVQLVDEDGNVTYTTKTVTEGGNKVYLDIYDNESKELLYSFVVAGKNVGGARTRRNKVDVKIID